MKKLVLVLMLLINHLAFAQWQNINPTPTPGTLRDICMINASTVYAVGTISATLKPVALKSTDGGTTWSSITGLDATTAPSTYSTLFFRNGGSNGWIMGPYTLDKTTDGGNTWTHFVNATIAVPASLNFIDNNQGWVTDVTGVDKIYHTVDGGANWTAQPTGTTVALSSVSFFNASIGAACGANGTILTTNNSGASWTTVTTGTAETLISIKMLGVDSYIAVGLNGTIFTKLAGIPGGGLVTSGTTLNLSSVSVLAGTLTAWACGANGTILKTLNGGATWTTGFNDNTAGLNSIYVFDANTGIACGSNGALVKSTTAGGIWFSLSSSVTSTPLSDCQMVNDKGWAVGEPGTILNTIDGGLHWTVQPHPAGALSIKSVSFSSETLGWANSKSNGHTVGSGAAANSILKTTNGGATWTSVTTLVPYEINVVKTIPTGGLPFVVIGGDDGHLARSDDNGTTWYSLNTADNTRPWNVLGNGFYPNLISLHLFSISNWLVGTQNGEIYRTTNGDALVAGGPGQIISASWVRTFSSGTGTPIRSFSFSSNSVGWANDDAHLYKTIDNGQTWSEPGTTGLTGGYNKVYFRDATHGFIAGTDGIFYSQDGGATWFNINSQAGVPLQAMGFSTTSDAIVAVGLLGSIQRHAGLGIVLPATLLNFSGRPNEKTIDLNWEASMQQNHKGFEIQKLNGKDWMRYGFVAGAGNSSVPTKYNYTDATPSEGNNIYRLKQIDADGKFSFSPEINVKMVGLKLSLSISPNPAIRNSFLTYSLGKKQQVTIQLLNSSGILLKTISNVETNAGVYITAIPMNDVPKGMYYVLMKTAEGSITKKLIIQ